MSYNHLQLWRGMGLQPAAKQQQQQLLQGDCGSTASSQQQHKRLGSGSAWFPGVCGCIGASISIFRGSVRGLQPGKSGFLGSKTLGFRAGAFPSVPKPDAK